MIISPQKKNDKCEAHLPFSRSLSLDIEELGLTFWIVSEIGFLLYHSSSIAKLHLLKVL